MFTYTDLYALMETTPLRGWLDTLPRLVAEKTAAINHGSLDVWQEALQQLPDIPPEQVDLREAVRVETAVPLDTHTQTRLEAQLRRFHPWRKGPFFLHGIHLDTEWRSDWKWDRVEAAIAPLNGRVVLDVGSGNGYYGWRMIGAGARLVMGLDPYLLYVMQYHAISQLLGPWPNYVLPLGVEDLPPDLHAFDTLFSMGVLYHRRSPMDHLIQCRDALREAGQLVLETLVIEGQAGEVLVPEGRYAKMRNVWFIPSVPTLVSWLRKCQFQKIEVVDVSVTTVEEQRSTSWMTFHSLADFLDPIDPSRTAEGHPAPRRVVITAVAP